MAADMTYTLDQFVADAREVVEHRLGDLKTVQALTPLLERIVSRPGCLADRGGPAAPDQSFDIYTSDDLTIGAIVWQPNVGAPAHNHNGWAMVGVVQGHERNTTYRRKDDGSKPWTAELEKASTVDVLPGQSAYVLPPDDIHSVAIPSGKTVAIHLFGSDIHRQWRCTFDLETGQVKPFIRRG